MMEIKAFPYADLRYPISVDETGSYADYLLDSPDKMPELVLGSRVIIEDKRNGDKVWIEGTVVGIRAISPFNLDRESQLFYEPTENQELAILRNISGPHDIQKYLIRLKLNSEIEKDHDIKRFIINPIQRPPSSKSVMKFPKLKEDPSGSEPSLETMLDLRKEGISVGLIGFGNHPYFTENDEFLTYKIDLKNLDNKHIFIVGESGSGKTVLLKQLTLEIKKMDNRNRVILTDVQGDLSQLLLNDLIEAPPSSGWQKRIEKTSHDEAIGSLKPFQLVVPVAGIEEENEHLIALKSLAKSRGVKVKDIGLRIRDLGLLSEVEYLYRVTSEQVAMVLDDIMMKMRNDDKGEQINLEVIERGLKNKLKERKREVEINGTIYYDSTVKAALRAIKNLSNYFDCHQPSMESSNNPLDALLEDGTTIVYLEHLNYEERLMWEMQIVKWLYENKNHKRKQGVHYYVFIDEAHQVIPAKPPGIGSKGTFARLRDNFEKLAREGRKFGINLILSTQSPTDLHEIVPLQCPTKIVMKIDPKNAKIANVDTELALIASRFNHGQMWLKSPFNGTPEWVRIHSWAPNLPHESMVHYWNKVLKAAREE